MRQWMTSFPIEDVVVRDKTMPNEEGVTSWGTGTCKQGGNRLDLYILSAN